MKKRFIILLLVFLPSTSFTQSIDDFFDEEGFELLGILAHPTNSYLSGDIITSNSYRIELQINYYGGYFTLLELTRVGNFFTEIEAKDDNDPLWIPPFLAVELMKDLAMDMVDYDSETASNFENYIGKTISEMNGTELACLILTVAWFNF